MTEKTLTEQLMTNRNITQDNLYLILPGKVSKMAVMYAEDFGVSIIEALKLIYDSETYRELEDESTKLWHLGPVALYEILLDEIRNSSTWVS